MLTSTNYTVDPNLFQEAMNHLPDSEMKTAINKPTGNFFYDAWELKEEYKGTVWETLYNSLPVTKGEARIIVLEPGQCYQSHADIDDRYHLNLAGNKSYLIDLETNQMHFLKPDGVWYDMDAGSVHSAANFGEVNRIQLVVRKLLKRNTITDAVEVTIVSDRPYQSRYVFDYSLSPWLNNANKKGYITDFQPTSTNVKFKISKDKLESLEFHLPAEFKII